MASRKVLPAAVAASQGRRWRPRRAQILLRLCLATTLVLIALSRLAPHSTHPAPAQRVMDRRQLIEPGSHQLKHSILPEEDGKQQGAAGAAAKAPSEAEEPAQAAGPCACYLPRALGPAGSLPGGGRHVLLTAAEQLQPALDAAREGDVVELADGIYDGMFNITVASGRAGAPITLCGSARAVLRGPSQFMNQTAVLLLTGVAHWRVAGITIENGYKAVWGQGVHHSLFEGLTMRELGEEGIRLCFNSTHNTIRGCTIYNAGRWMPGWGEGIYIGTSQGQWVTPDRSNHNRILFNRVGPGVAAECIDLKEWTEGALVEGNYCDGSGLQGQNFAVSLMSIKASRCVVRHNVAIRALGQGHGIHTVVREGGWGDFNLFENNTLDIQAGGYGIRITRKGQVGRGNIVKCSNTAPSAASGLSNVPCVP